MDIIRDRLRNSSNSAERDELLEALKGLVEEFDVGGGPTVKTDLVNALNISGAANATKNPPELSTNSRVSTPKSTSTGANKTPLTGGGSGKTTPNMAAAAQRLTIDVEEADRVHVIGQKTASNLDENRRRLQEQQQFGSNNPQPTPINLTAANIQLIQGTPSAAASSTSMLARHTTTSAAAATTHNSGRRTPNQSATSAGRSRTTSGQLIHQGKSESSPSAMMASAQRTNSFPIDVPSRLAKSVQGTPTNFYHGGDSRSNTPTSSLLRNQHGELIYAERHNSAGTNVSSPNGTTPSHYGGGTNNGTNAPNTMTSSSLSLPSPAGVMSAPAGYLNSRSASTMAGNKNPLDLMHTLNEDEELRLPIGHSDPVLPAVLKTIGHSDPVLPAVPGSGIADHAANPMNMLLTTDDGGSGRVDGQETGATETTNVSVAGASSRTGTGSKEKEEPVQMTLQLLREIVSANSSSTRSAAESKGELVVPQHNKLARYKDLQVSLRAEEALIFRSSRSGEFEHVFRVCGNPLCRRKWKQLTRSMLPTFCPTCRRIIEQSSLPAFSATSSPEQAGAAKATGGGANNPIVAPPMLVAQPQQLSTPGGGGIAGGAVAPSPAPSNSSSRRSNSLLKHKLSRVYESWYRTYLQLCRELAYPAASEPLQPSEFFSTGPDVPRDLTIAEEEYFMHCMQENLPVIEASTGDVKNWNSMLVRKKYLKGYVESKVNFLCKIVAEEELDADLNPTGRPTSEIFWYLDFRSSLEEQDVFPFLSIPNPAVNERNVLPKLCKLIRDDGEGPLSGAAGQNNNSVGVVDDNKNNVNRNEFQPANRSAGAANNSTINPAVFQSQGNKINQHGVLVGTGKSSSSSSHGKGSKNHHDLHHSGGPDQQQKGAGANNGPNKGNKKSNGKMMNNNSSLPMNHMNNKGGGQAQGQGGKHNNMHMSQQINISMSRTNNNRSKSSVDSNHANLPTVAMYAAFDQSFQHQQQQQILLNANNLNPFMYTGPAGPGPGAAGPHQQGMVNNGGGGQYNYFDSLVASQIVPPQNSTTNLRPMANSTTNLRPMALQQHQFVRNNSNPHGSPGGGVGIRVNNSNQHNYNYVGPRPAAAGGTTSSAAGLTPVNTMGGAGGSGQHNSNSSSAFADLVSWSTTNQLNHSGGGHQAGQHNSNNHPRSGGGGNSRNNGRGGNNNSRGSNSKETAGGNGQKYGSWSHQQINLVQSGLNTPAHNHLPPQSPSAAYFGD
ncbi:unnamed protein product [Amoebophrya sp. A120]|nr:unnamed protein product [Amoebophrya sp. A120]|eukprot:GSA120T00012025001.1